ncbi:MAG: hypothetical protein ABI670_07420 [Chloroflexota bacterium]
MPDINSDERRTLINYFVNRYTLEQVETLLFVADINRNTFSTTATLPGLCTEVIQYCIGNGKLGCLLREALRDKPDPAVQAVYASWASCEPGVKIEVTIHDARLKDLGAALKAFMVAHGLKPNEVSLVAAASGSLWMLLAMPAHVAERIISFPVTVLAGGRFHVSALRLFRDLPPVEQANWRQAARNAPRVTMSELPDGGVQVEVDGVVSGTGPPLRIIEGGAAGGALGLGKILIVVLVVIAGSAGVGVATAPTLQLQNNCDIAIPLPQDIPLIGSEIPIGTSSFKIFPGDYTIAVVGNRRVQQLRVTGPLGIDTGPIDTGRNFTVTKDGVTPELNNPINVGFGSKIEVTFCSP